MFLFNLDCFNLKPKTFFLKKSMYLTFIVFTFLKLLQDTNIFSLIEKILNTKTKT